MTATTVDCLFCIESHMPAGRDTAMGELYERCPNCCPSCPDCHGYAVFPATYNSPRHLVYHLLTQRLGPVFCPGCYGVLTVISLEPPEATP